MKVRGGAAVALGAVICLGAPSLLVGQVRDQFVYVVHRLNSTVSGYHVDGVTGALAPVPLSPFPAGGRNPIDVTVDPSNRFVYVALGATPLSVPGALSGFAIDGSGNLQAVPGSPFRSGFDPEGVGIAVVGSTTYLYAVDQAQANIRQFLIDPPTGSLKRVGQPVPANTTENPNPRHVRVHPSNRFLYLADQSGWILAYAIDGVTGRPSFIGQVRAGDDTLDLAVDPSGQFLYATNNGTANISGYRIDPDQGTLAELAGSPFPTSALPHLLALTVSGGREFAYAAVGLDPGGVSTYEVDLASGALLELPDSPFRAGTLPIGVAIDPTGSYVYVTNAFSSDISGYFVDATTGAPTPLADSPYADSTAAPWGIAMTTFK